MALHLHHLLNINPYRCFCSERIKKLNFVNKALFGAVQKKHKIDPTQNAPKSVVDDKPTMVPLRPSPPPTRPKIDLSSEMYWMLSHTQQTAPPFNSVRKIKHKKTSITAATSSSSSSTIDKSMFLLKNNRSIRALNKPTKRSLEIHQPDTSPIPASLTKFTDSLCPVPIKLKSPNSDIIPSIRIPLNIVRLTDVLAVPAFGDALRSFPIMEAGDLQRVPSVGTILQATMPKAARKALQKWKLLKLAELGEAGFQQMQQAHLTSGSTFHLALQQYFEKQEVPLATSPPVTHQMWQSVNSILANIKPIAELVEAPIFHPILQYKGIVDCVSTIDDLLHVIEWKKSDRQKAQLTSTFDAPLQMCAYLGAINADKRYANLRSVRNGLIVIAYTDGRPAHSFRLTEKDINRYWEQWLRRLHEFWIRSRDGTLPEPI